jgi:hypothetical protein
MPQSASERATFAELDRLKKMLKHNHTEIGATSSHALHRADDAHERIDRHEGQGGKLRENED